MKQSQEFQECAKEINRVDFNVMLTSKRMNLHCQMGYFMHWGEEVFCFVLGVNRLLQNLTFPAQMLSLKKSKTNRLYFSQ